MKKTLNLLMMLLALFAFTSCGSDNGEPASVNPEYLGAWVDGDYMLVFKNNGNFDAYEGVNFVDRTYTDKVSGRWSYKNKIVNMTLDRSASAYKAFKVLYKDAESMKVSFYDPTYGGDLGEGNFRKVDDKQIPKKKV